MNLKRDPDFMRKIGKKGGLATKRKLGINHFKKLGKKGARSTQKLWEEINKKEENKKKN